MRGEQLPIWKGSISSVFVDARSASYAIRAQCGASRSEYARHCATRANLTRSQDSRVKRELPPRSTHSPPPPPLSRARIFPRNKLRFVIDESAHLELKHGDGAAAESSAWLYIFANSAVTLSRRFARHLTAYGDTRNSRNYIYAPFVESDARAKTRRGELSRRGHFVNKFVFARSREQIRLLY